MNTYTLDTDSAVNLEASLDSNNATVVKLTSYNGSPELNAGDTIEVPTAEATSITVTAQRASSVTEYRVKASSTLGNNTRPFTGTESKVSLAHAVPSDNDTTWALKVMLESLAADDDEPPFIIISPRLTIKKKPAGF